MKKMKVHVRFLAPDQYEYVTLCGIDGATIDEHLRPDEETATVEQLLQTPIRDDEEYLCEVCTLHQDYALLLLGES